MSNVIPIRPAARPAPRLVVAKIDQDPQPRLTDAGRRAYAADKLDDAIRVAAVVFSRGELVAYLQQAIAGQMALAAREARP